MNLFSQEQASYYGSNGESVCFEVVDSLVYIEFLNNTSESQKGNFLKRYSKTIDKDELKKSSVLTILKDKADTDKLKENSNIKRASKVLRNEQGKLVATKDGLFVKMKPNQDISSLLNFLSIDYYKINEIDGLPQTYIIKILSDDIFEVVNIINLSGKVEYAEPAFVRFGVKHSANYFDLQWGLNNTGQFGGTPGVDINILNAWTITKGSPNIKVAIIGGGIDSTHPDLQGNILTAYDATLGDVIVPIEEHETACAGIIAAKDNNIGVSGVAPNCKILPLLVDDYYDEHVINAFTYAKNNADVISCSFGYGHVDSNTTLTNKINEVSLNGRNNKGCVIVFSTGNEGTSTISYPALLDNVLAVGGATYCGTRKRRQGDPEGISCDGILNYGSNYGEKLDLIAPGVEIYTTDIAGNGGYNSGDYVSLNGTSFSCPMVAGVAALALSANPNLTASEVRSIIKSTCTELLGYNYTTTPAHPDGRWNEQVGYGLVNALNALLKAAPPTISGPGSICDNGSFSINGLPTGSTVTWTGDTKLSLSSVQGRIPATFNKAANGRGNVTARINFPNRTDQYVINKTVGVGTPSRPHLYTTTGTNTNAAVIYTLYYGSPTIVKLIQLIDPPTSAGVNDYTITKTVNPGNFQIIQNGRDITVIPLALGAGQFTIRPYNSCGQGEIVTVNLDIQKKTSGGIGIELPQLPIFAPAIYPNPTPDIVTVELNAQVPLDRGGEGEGEGETELTVAKTEKVSYNGDYIVQIWNEYGLVKTVDCNTPVSQVSLQSLPAGTYYLHIVIEGKTVYRQVVRKM